MTGPRVIFTHNYSMPAARKAWKEGKAPAHHLSGMAVVEAAGYECVYLDWRDRSSGRVVRGLESRIGDLRTEAQALRNTDRRSVLYAGDPFSFAGLALARSLGTLRTPVMAAIHPRTARSALRDRELRSYDACVCLSRVVRDELVAEVGRDPATTVLLPWGPDLDFAGYHSTGEQFVVSTGKTHRDVGTLLAALAGLGIPARVHIPNRSEDDGVVRIVPTLPYSTMLDYLQQAAVVAIPLHDIDQLAGITEVNDALALGKPLVVTRTPYLDADIEAIDCGFVIEPGDVDGWRSALTKLWNDPGLRHEMGRRGREFAEREWNAGLFGAGVLQLIEAVSRG